MSFACPGLRLTFRIFAGRLWALFYGDYNGSTVWNDKVDA